MRSDSHATFSMHPLTKTHDKYPPCFEPYKSEDKVNRIQHYGLLLSSLNPSPQATGIICS